MCVSNVLIALNLSVLDKEGHDQSRLLRSSASGRSTTAFMSKYDIIVQLDLCFHLPAVVK